MKRFIQVHVDSEGFDRVVTRMWHQRIHLGLETANPVKSGWVLEPFRGQPCRRSLEDAAHFDSIPNVTDGEFANHEAAGGRWLPQPLVGKPVKRKTDRRPRYAQAFHQSQFRKPLPG